MFEKLKNLWKGKTAYNADHVGQVWPVGSGRTVTVDANGDIVFATCIEILAKQLGQVRWGLYAGDNNEIAPMMRLYNYVLNISPYHGMTAFDFWSYMEKQRLGTGNALAYIKYNDKGQLESLVPLDGSNVKIYWDNSDLFEAKRRIIYEYTDNVGGQSVVMLPDEILHFKAFSANGVSGRPAITVLRDTLQSNAEVEGALRSAVSNGFHGTIVLQYTSDLSIQKQTALQKKVKALLANSNHSILPLPVGMTAQNITNDIKAYHDTLKSANAQAISSFFGIPLVMLNIGGGTGMATFSSNQITQYYNLTVAPIIQLYANELSVKLLMRSQLNKGYSFDSVNDAFDFLDPQAKANVLGAYKSGGILSANEVRTSLKYPASESEGADDLIGGNYEPVTGTGDGDRHDQQ